MIRIDAVVDGIQYDLHKQLHSCTVLPLTLSSHYRIDPLADSRWIQAGAYSGRVYPHFKFLREWEWQSSWALCMYACTQPRSASS